MVAQNITFGILAASAILGALRVVTTKNVVHAALYLVVVLASVGATFLLLAAEFVAVVQYLVYIGAIVVLFLFGVMLTRARMGHEAELDNNQRGLAAVVGLFLAGILAYVLVDYTNDLPRDKLPELKGTAEHISRTRGTGPVGDAIFSTYLVPFEVVSVLLLAALVGAIVIARRD